MARGLCYVCKDQPKRITNKCTMCGGHGWIQYKPLYYDAVRAGPIPVLPVRRIDDHRVVCRVQKTVAWAKRGEEYELLNLRLIYDRRTKTNPLHRIGVPASHVDGLIAYQQTRTDQ